VGNRSISCRTFSTQEFEHLLAGLGFIVRSIETFPFFCALLPEACLFVLAREVAAKELSETESEQVLFHLEKRAVSHPVFKHLGMYITAIARKPIEAA